MALSSDTQYVGWGLPAEMTSNDGVPHITISGASLGGVVTNVPQVIASGSWVVRSPTSPVVN